MEISGVIKSIPFYKSETGYGVFKTDQGTVTGYAQNVGVGKHITAEGTHFTHPMHGEQFKAHSISVTNPSDVENLTRMLTAAKIPGVGKVAVGKLLAYFGTDVLRNLNDVEVLKKAGVSAKQIQAILAYHEQTQGNQAILELLGRAGLGVKTIAAILAYKHQSAVTSNPYSMLGEVPRLSFANVDKIWQVLHGDVTAPPRILAGVMEAMRRTREDGNTGITLDDLTCTACSLLKVSSDLVKPVISDTLAAELIEYPIGSNIIFKRETWREERVIAERLIHIQNAVQHLTNTIDVGTLTDEQHSGIVNVMNNGVSIITGSPGTGKTTVINALCNLADVNNIQVALLAPTGMAARRMRDTSGREATTIHSFLRHPKITKDTIIIMDESSMVSTNLMHTLLSKLKVRCRIVFVGDVHQLPSIDYGQILNDLIMSEQFPVTRLTKTFRFGDDIGGLARIVLSGDTPNVSDDPNNTTTFIECADDAMISDTIINLIEQVTDAQVLTPVKDGLAGALELNSRIAELLNPGVLRTNILNIGVGDRVANTKNDYEHGLVNGSIGIVKLIDNGDISIEYDVGVVTLPLTAANVSMAYALTVHKAQGQEYDTVIIALSHSKPVMLQRRLLYTAITRAKRKVLIVGTKRAIDIVAEGTFNAARVTGLVQHLIDVD